MRSAVRKIDDKSRFLTDFLIATRTLERTAALMQNGLTADIRRNSLNVSGPRVSFEIQQSPPYSLELQPCGKGLEKCVFLSGNLYEDPGKI